MKNALLTILIIFWRALVFLPRTVQNVFSQLFGYVFLLLPLKRNKFSKTNIDLCFPELSKKERNQIYKKNVISFGDVIFSTGIAWFWSDSRIKKNISYEINGLDTLLNYQKSNTGIMLFFKHSLHLELDARLLSISADIFGVERKHNSEKFQSLQRNGRLKSMKGVADRNSTLSFVRWLKNGKTVLYAPDQDYGKDKSIESTFFNLPASTISAPLKIIEKTGCKTFFINTYFKKKKLIINLEETKFDQSSASSFIKDLNDYIESKIKLNPHEYLWQHRRFKSTLGKNKIYK